ncbi:aquaporin-11 isoform X2 [Eurytemora carolleeae]|uniref:aquaporin-11 isoform X2 n=1 Tax=Eurytemora carolleeae TaxID=1294199 RepID=UPI000C777311|nr:aquaporin-11 isoform X2 [Eurytemora carolleeae]|eukprot:XP_023345339.1 aquaporin-11-like isoform X2 [Eurytemora affinis]
MFVSLGIISSHIFLFYLAIFLFLFVVWQIVAWEGYSSSPIDCLLSLEVWGILRSLVMLAGTLASYRYMSGGVWSAGLSEYHSGLEESTSLNHCSYPFNHHSLFILALTEFSGSCVLTFLADKIFSNNFLINNDPEKYFSGSIFAFFVIIFVLLGMDISGAMFHPTLATLLLGGCKGQGALEHILVYWLAPISGVWSARWLQRLPTKDIPQSEKKKKLKSS